MDENKIPVIVGVGQTQRSVHQLERIQTRFAFRWPIVDLAHADDDGDSARVHALSLRRLPAWPLCAMIDA